MLAQNIQKWLFVTLGTSLVVCVGLVLGVFSTWQTRLSDQLFHPVPPDSRIVIIAIDDASLQAIGRWPWPRSTYARLLEKLNAQPTVVGLDISFFETSTAAEDATLTKAFKESEVPVVLAAEQLPHSINLLTPIFSDAPLLSSGIVNVITDQDGVVRTWALENSFSWQILESIGNQAELSQTRRVAYVGAPGTFPMYSFHQVLSGAVAAETFKDKIVLVGATAPDLHDFQQTPVSAGQAMSGVEIQANAIHTLLTNRQLDTEPLVVSLATILGLVFVLSILFYFLSIRWSVALAVLVILSYLGYAIWSFDQGIIRNLIYPLLSILISLIASIVLKYTTANAQKRFLKRAFSYYLSAPVLAEILKNPKTLRLGGSKQEMTVLFSDIAGFTSVSEKISPEILTHFLNRYLTAMTDLVFEHRGVLDKYIGDAVMAFWGAPIPEKNSALLACQTALAMQAKINESQAEWKEEFGVPELVVRIGINTGEMVVGNFGSLSRFDYTVLGDNVNLASRLEGINKEYDTKIIISQATYQQVESIVIARRLDTVAVKGKTKGVTIYELLGMRVNANEEPQESLMNLDEKLNEFEVARKKYQKGEFDIALRLFTELAKKWPTDGPTQMYIQRCQELIATPPEAWDGVFRATRK
jgi:adenylate cyclase